jgi:hypothetical protein
MHSLVQTIRSRHRELGFDDAAKRRDAMRIADGKLLLKHVKKRYAGSGKWDGHLHGELAQSDYSDRFRDALLEATNTPRRVILPNHAAAQAA